MTSGKARLARESQYLDGILAELEDFLSGVIPDGDPPALFDACRYVLASGGKRVRPTLVVLASDVFGGSRAVSVPIAAACEVFHNFTLVHDDIMDRSDIRRGRPTVHKAWDDSTAILVGDYLLALSYDLLEHAPQDQGQDIRRAFGRMVRRLCEGQALDMEFAGSGAVSMHEYLTMIDGKTGALLACCLEIGARAAGAGDDVAATLHKAGLDLGRAFQIQDDLLDATAQGSAWGKSTRQDLLEGKRTFLVVDMISNGEDEDRRFFADALESGGFSPDQTDEAVRRLATAGVLDRAGAAVAEYSRSARTAIETLPEGTASMELQSLVDGLGQRSH